MVRNDNDYIKHVIKNKKKTNYMRLFGALRKGRNENTTYKDAFNSLISDLRKKKSEME